MPALVAPKAPRNSPNVAFTRAEYDSLLPRWILIRDCIAGELQVKSRKDAYLPKPNAADTSPENEARYTAYLLRAMFFNSTGRTLHGLVGQVMAEDPQLVLPELLEPLKEDIDGGSMSFVQQASKTLSLVTSYGRAGLMVDYPTVERAATRKQLLEAEVRPTINLIEPWDIINWRTISVGSTVKLSAVVIAEQYISADDGFELEWEPQWRVLRLDEQGLYVLEEWVRDPDNKDEFILKPLASAPGRVAQYYPTGSDGRRLDYIPFQFLGATTNSPHPDLPPLYDLASLNIGHYRNSADYEEACYMLGQPTPYFTGLTEDWVKDMLKGTIQLGSRAAVLLPENATAGLLQVEENGMVKEAMEMKERQMVALGAKLVEQKTVQRTAAEAGMDKAAETSVLATIANNVSRGYEAALRFALGFVDRASMEVDDVVEVELNTSFKISQMDPQARAQLMAEWMGGGITDEEYRLNLTRAGVATEEFDDWNDKREEQVLNRPITPPAVDPNKKTAEKPGDEKTDPAKE